MAEKTSILIVEDEAPVAEDLQEMLELMGYEFAGTADTGAGAIEFADEYHPDLILMDIQLSGTMDGIAAAGKIRSRWGIPVIFITAFTTESIIERAKKTLPSGYIIKPFNKRQIQTAIEIALYNAGIEQELATERIALQQSREDLRVVNKLLEEKVQQQTRELIHANLALTDRNRSLAISNAGTRALLQADNEADLLSCICQDLINSGGYAHAWIATLNACGDIIECAVAGDDQPGLTSMIRTGRLISCIESGCFLKEGGVVLPGKPPCADCPLTRLQRDGSMLFTYLDGGPVRVGMLGITLLPDVRIWDTETPLIKRIAREIAFVILYLRTKDHEQKAFRQITKNIEQLSILNDHIRNPLQGIVGYASMGDGEIFQKILAFSAAINSIVSQLDNGYLESKLVYEFLIRHGEIENTSGCQESGKSI